MLHSSIKFFQEFCVTDITLRMRLLCSVIGKGCVSVTTNNKGTLLPRCSTFDIHCPLIGILFPSDAVSDNDDFCK